MYLRDGRCRAVIRVWLTGHLGEDKIGQLEKEIENLHAEERVDEIERRVAPTFERLKALIRKLGS